MGPLVFCPNGHVFESRAFNFGRNARNVVLRGNIESCPFCGFPAGVMDGTFDFVEGTIRVLAAPQSTLSRLQALRRILQETTPDQVLEVVKETDPQFADALRRLLPRDPGRAIQWLVVLLAVLTMLINLKQLAVSEHPPPAPVDQQLTERQIEEIIQDVIAAQSHTEHTGTNRQPPSHPSESGEATPSTTVEQRVYENQPIRIAQLAGDSFMISNATFTRCQIIGPAVLVLHGASSLVNSNLGADSDALLWEIPATRTRIAGAVRCLDCLFESCDFTGIGFAGPPDFVAAVKDSMGGD